MGTDTWRMPKPVAWVSIFSSFAIASADTNIYGHELAQCGSSQEDGCPYSPGDQGAHEVCVRSLPHGFSSSTGQGSWSDEYTGKHWCICIWAYSNYILHKDDLPLKCDAIPSKVLKERYSLDKFKQCGLMSSRQGCGVEDIRRSIQSLCTQCSKQAPDSDAKQNMDDLCTTILASAPATQAGKQQAASTRVVAGKL